MLNTSYIKLKFILLVQLNYNCRAARSTTCVPVVGVTAPQNPTPAQAVPQTVGYLGIYKAAMFAWPG